MRQTRYENESHDTVKQIGRHQEAMTWREECESKCKVVQKGYLLVPNKVISPSNYN